MAVVGSGCSSSMRAKAATITARKAIATTWIGVGATRGHAGHHRVATPGTFERFADDGTIVVDVIVRVGVRQRRALVKADVYQLEIAYILRK